MLVRYWQPLKEMDLVRRQFDQLFDELTQSPATNNSKTDTQVTWRPAVELETTDDQIIVRAQLPGMAIQDLDVEVTQEAVSISGERRKQDSEQNDSLKSEFRYGKFQRVISLPAVIQTDKVQAEYKDGILTLTLPKVIEVRNKVVKINLAEQLQPSLDQ
jgi:HSP20 family protein